MDFHLGTAPQEKDCLAVPLGAAYGVKTYNDASMLRKRICEVLGGVRACAKDDLVSCARPGEVVEMGFRGGFKPICLDLHENSRSASNRVAPGTCCWLLR